MNKHTNLSTKWLGFLYGLFKLQCIVLILSIISCFIRLYQFNDYYGSLYDINDYIYFIIIMGFVRLFIKIGAIKNNYFEERSYYWLLSSVVVDGIFILSTGLQYNNSVTYFLASILTICIIIVPNIVYIVKRKPLYFSSAIQDNDINNDSINYKNAEDNSNNLLFETSIDESSYAIKPKSKYCRKCGNELIEGSLFCSKCGTKLEEKQ